MNVLVIILGHVPLEFCIAVNVLATNPQLSLTAPPAPVNSASVVGIAGTAPIHSNDTFAGHVTTGGVLSSIVIVWTHCPIFPQESAIVNVLVIILGHVPFEF